MFHYKFHYFLAISDDINAVFIVRRADAEFVAGGFKFIQFLAEGVIDTYRAEVFALYGHEIMSGVGEEDERLLFGFVHSGFAGMLLVAFSLHGLDDVFKRGRIDVSFGDGVVGADEHEAGIKGHGDGLDDVVAATSTADDGILHAELFYPVLAGRVIAVGGDSHEEHVVLVATEYVVCFDDVAHGLFAERVASEEEVDEHGLAGVEDVVKVDFLAFEVGAGEINYDFGSAARACNDGFLYDFAEVAVKVGGNGVNHIFCVGFQFGEGVRKNAFGGEAVVGEILRQFEARQAHPLLDFALGGHHVVVGCAVGVRREGYSNLGFKDLVDVDAHLGIADGSRSVAVVLFDAVWLQSIDDGVGATDGPKVLDDDLAVGCNQDAGGEHGYAVLDANISASSNSTDGRVFHTVVGGPIDAGRLAVAFVDFHKKHVVHVATKGVIGLFNVWDGLDAAAASGVEEVDEHILSAVEDVEQVHFVAVDVGCREIDGFRDVALRFQAHAKSQREKQGKEFFH